VHFHWDDHPPVLFAIGTEREVHDWRMSLVLPVYAAFRLRDDGVLRDRVSPALVVDCSGGLDSGDRRLLLAVDRLEHAGLVRWPSRDEQVAVARAWRHWQHEPEFDALAALRRAVAETVSPGS
jgi:hypothetical protein